VCRHRARSPKHAELRGPRTHVRPIVLTLLLASLTFGSVIGFARDRPVNAMLAAAKTGKERLGDKASDEQRVNDCKVPETRRTRVRSADCLGHKGSWAGIAGSV